ncbi:MAG TPA: lipase maturation factor family protein [Bdellovibrionales bacterium]|nr:lipase maturation factor family protein [Bdellovibrionales bacterium]
MFSSHGVAPIRDYMAAVERGTDESRYWQVPSLFWLDQSNEFLMTVAVTGAVAAAAVVFGFAQGWMLLVCFLFYLSFVSAGQPFMAFQWDSLLLEVGFVALFAVSWNWDFGLRFAAEPHWSVRWMFLLVLFKLMFLSGVVKIMSGDESWRDFSALSFHYWTQPLPNPASLFMHAMPLWTHRVATFLTFAIELILPFLMFWPRARVGVAFGFIGLSVLILLTGNYTFFNFLTIALCVWLIPDSWWERVWMPLDLEISGAPLFVSPVTVAVMSVLALLTFVWCTRWIYPESVLTKLWPTLRTAQALHISSSYGLFAVMTKTRSEIVIEGSMDGREWKEYEFKYKPGGLYRTPPVVAPHQPRLDWQMWFAALGSFPGNPWIGNLMLRIFESRAEVLSFFAWNPFPDTAPKYLRARMYDYQMTRPGQLFDSGQWWTRQPLGNYTPIFENPAAGREAQEAK